MTRLHAALAGAAAVLGLAAAAADAGSADIRSLAADIAAERDHVSAPDLADAIMRQEPSLQVIDLRSRDEYDAFHIPSATQASVEEVAKAAFPPGARIVLYSEGGTHSAQAWMLLRLRGYRHVTFLREGIYEWMARVVEPRLAVDATPTERTEFARAEVHSRYFGGLPRAGVPRAEVPGGYWSAALSSTTAAGATSAGDLVARVRRRGC